MRYASSWTGSERKRKPQGGVAQASRPMGKAAPARYSIPAGTLVLIRKPAEYDWRDYETKKYLEFDRYDSRNAAHRYYEFRFEGYLIRVRNADLHFREQFKA